MNEPSKQIKLAEPRLLELKEFCVASTTSQNPRGTAEVRCKTLREILWMHRFDVYTYLMSQGVAIPPNVLCDEANPRPGDQSPDKPMPDEPDPR